MAEYAPSASAAAAASGFALGSATGFGELSRVSPEFTTSIFWLQPLSSNVRTTRKTTKLFHILTASKLRLPLLHEGRKTFQKIFAVKAFDLHFVFTGKSCLEIRGQTSIYGFFRKP